MQLEDLLRTSTKNVAQEVVSSLIPSNGGMGVLADIERTYNQQASTLKKGSTRRADEGEFQDQVLHTDSSNRGTIPQGSSAAARQSRSANAAARSLTRRNQQQLGSVNG
jgi:hypothetical protein